MTGTTNLGLKKIDGTENWRNIFDYHNDSMDAIDQAVAGVENVEANFSVTIPVSGWTLSNGEYSYTWGNATITSKTSVAVEFVENADEIDVDYIEAEKVTQGVKFTAPWIPNYAISVNIKITYAAETDISELTGDMVATDVITGAANVDEALAELDTDVKALASDVGQWEVVDFTIPAAAGGALFLKNETSKLVIISYNSGTVANVDTTIQWPEGLTPAFQVYGSLRSGYLRAGPTGLAIYNTAAYSVGFVVYPLQ